MLYLTIGNLAQALGYAQQGVDFADRSDDAFQKMGKRANYANALHQAGRTAEAEALFNEAEAMQKERQPSYPILYSMQGIWYCDLLLDQGRRREVQDRAEQTLQWAKRNGLSLLTVAMNHLSLGRAHLGEAQQAEAGDFSKAAQHLGRAVDGLRQAGNQEFIVRGLLARAALPRLRSDFERARRDLDEAMSIAERGSMGLYQVDARLESTRLDLAMGNKPNAREHLAAAKEKIEHMGYHRRDGDVAKLEEQTGDA